MSRITKQYKQEDLNEIVLLMDNKLDVNLPPLMRISRLIKALYDEGVVKLRVNGDMKTVFVLYLITNLGPSFKFEYIRVVAVFSSIERCQDRVSKLTLSESYMRFECKSEEFYQ